MSCTSLSPLIPILYSCKQQTNNYRYDLKQMLIKSPISRVPEELRKHEAAQQKPNRMARKAEESSVFGGKTGW